jgi:hypothetical protein
VQDQRPPLGDEVQTEVGADHGFPERGLQREVELVDGLEEREVCSEYNAAVAFASLEPLRICLASRHFFSRI